MPFTYVYKKSLIRRRMRKQKAHTLSIMGSPNGLRNGRTNIHNLQNVATGLLIQKWDRVRNHDSRQFTLIQSLDCVSGEDTMGYDSDYFAGFVGHDRFGSFDECAARIGHIVDKNGDFVYDVADEDHAGDFVGTGAFFVDECETEVKTICDGGCSVGVVSFLPIQIPVDFNISFSHVENKAGNRRRRISHLLAPPASGLTTTQSFTCKFSLIHLSVLGSAYRLSTGTLKNPWI